MADDPVLITDAAPSPAEDLAHRRRVYTILMVVHIVGFGLSYPLYLWEWWAGVAAVVVTGVLPWVAVLLANDAPRRSGRRAPHPGRPAAGQPSVRQLPAGGSRPSPRPTPSG